jgi:hypothetical protein
MAPHRAAIRHRARRTEIANSPPRRSWRVGANAPLHQSLDIR